MANKIRDAKREAFWRRVLGRQRNGGHSIRTFCRSEKLREPSFYAWRRVIAQRDAERSPRRSMSSNSRKRRRVRRPTPRRAFVPVVLGGNQPPEPAGIVLELRGGRRLLLSESMPAARLAELIGALESAPQQEAAS
ncbi:MAG: hypothetical protein K8T25_13910 [Planctomycetia bacterium]|nr:hypothetical protein [Planctomycetia bacterium]